MRFAGCCILMAAGLALAGCGSGGGPGGSTHVTSQCKTPPASTVTQPVPTANYAGTTLSGTVLAGNAPLAGASVQLYAAGTSGNGSAPTALDAAVVTDANGNFALTTAYTCPFNTSLLYLVARGGSVGAGPPTIGTVLATAVGPCNALTPGTAFVIDEATTVATAYAFAQFLSPGAKMGATATNFHGLVLAAATAANLVNTQTGFAPGASFPPTGTAPTAEIDTLANALNACIVSSGTSSAACSQLYSGAVTAPASVPTNTLDAVLALAQNPSTATSGVYAVAGMSGAYSPVLTAPPSDWTMFATFGGGGLNAPTALSFDSNGDLWVANYYSVASRFTNTGAPVFASGITGDSLENGFGLAVDQNDVAWFSDQETAYSVNNALGALTRLNSSGALVAVDSSGGIDFPLGVAIDRGGTTWVASYGDSTVTLLSNAGVPLSGSTGLASAMLAFPVAVATDSNCYGYVGNQSTFEVTRVAPDGSSFVNYTVGDGPNGVAVDADDNVWSANYYGNTVGLISAAGAVASGSGFSGGGLYYPAGIAVDGGGTVWVTNYRAPGITRLAGAMANSPGAALSPSNGLGVDAKLVFAFAPAIDSSGNLWVTSYASDTLTEFIGLAVPVKTPLIGPVQLP
jgi:sugar lactone lactonase YvrE